MASRKRAKPEVLGAWFGLQMSGLEFEEPKERVEVGQDRADLQGNWSGNGDNVMGCTEATAILPGLPYFVPMKHHLDARSMVKSTKHFHFNKVWANANKQENRTQEEQGKPSILGL